MSDKVEKSQKGLRGQMAFQAQLATEMARLYSFDHYQRNQDDDELEIVSVKIRFGDGDGTDFLGIVNAYVAGEPKVGFHGGSSFLDCLKGLCERVQNRSIKWKDDDYAK